MVKRVLFFVLGYVAFMALLQWFIIATREPMYPMWVRCDGGIEDLTSDREIDA